MRVRSSEESFAGSATRCSIRRWARLWSLQYWSGGSTRNGCPGGGFLLPQSEKSILKILPAPHTRHPVFQLANPTAQQFVIPGSNVHVSPSSVVHADPPGPVATTVSLLRSGT